MQRRPTTAMVFGVLSIVFGALGILGSAISLAFQLDDPGRNPAVRMIPNPAVYMAWVQFSMIVGIVCAVLVLICGIGLLWVRDWARRLLVGYGVFAIVFGLVGIAVHWIYFVGPIVGEDAVGGNPAMVGFAVGGVVGGAIGMVYPALLVIFLTRPGLKATFRAWPNPPRLETPYAPPTQAVSETPAIDGDNPYAPPTAPLEKWPGGDGPTGDELISKLVPTRNKPALVAYYFGLFALLGVVPFLGLIGIALAAVAVPSGIVGLRRAGKNPEVRGKVHAWVGVLCGALGGGIGLIVHGLLFLALLAG